jgi:hypothetical protein
MQTTHTQANASEAAILSRVLTNGENGPSRELARHILNVTFTDADKARMHELAEKNQEGTISPEELQELDNYVNVGDLLAILQSKARMALKKQRHS